MSSFLLYKAKCLLVDKLLLPMFSDIWLVEMQGLVSGPSVDGWVSLSGRPSGNPFAAPAEDLPVAAGLEGSGSGVDAQYLSVPVLMHPSIGSEEIRLQMVATQVRGYQYTSI